jgi:hypothetical protein
LGGGEMFIQENLKILKNVVGLKYIALSNDEVTTIDNQS